VFALIFSVVDRAMRRIRQDSLFALASVRQRTIDLSISAASTHCPPHSLNAFLLRSFRLTGAPHRARMPARTPFSSSDQRNCRR
jgi:hypothetical protein